jgi:hypothetical protein
MPRLSIKTDDAKEARGSANRAVGKCATMTDPSCAQAQHGSADDYCNTTSCTRDQACEAGSY